MKDAVNGENYSCQYNAKIFHNMQAVLKHNLKTLTVEPTKSTQNLKNTGVECEAAEVDYCTFVY